MTPRALWVLRAMLQAEAEDRLEDAEIVCDAGDAWVGDEKISMRTVNRLLQLALLRSEGLGGCEHHTLNDEGRRMARDPSYVPLIEPHLRTFVLTTEGIELRSLVSPLALVQERVSRDLHYPWRVIACCALLNRTQGAQVRPMLAGFERACPSPESALSADLSALLTPLGLQNRRAALLRRMTWDYLAGAQPGECHGVGQYGRDALLLFVGARTDLEPGDRWLRPYLRWRRSEEGRTRPVSWDREGHDAWRRESGFPRLRMVK